jgi:hydrogenase 3 maturation protease
LAGVPRLTKDEYELHEELEKWLAGAKRVVVAGIGNPIRRDDFVGVKIVQELQGKVSGKVFLLECETVPESYLSQIVEFDPTHVLLIDSAFLGLKPGATRLMNPERLTGFSAVTTHILPLRLFCDYITAMTKAKMCLLLIEPCNVEFGEGLTPEVDAAAEIITKALLKHFSAI